jgi:WD40 repeat protein
VTVSWDKTARVWDATTGKEIARFERHTDIITRVAWSFDNRRILTASRDATARLWHVFATMDELIQTAKSLVSRCLTLEERRLYFLPDAPPPWCVERRLWPYHTEEWQAWLSKRRAWLATREGPEPALPKNTPK